MCMCVCVYIYIYIYIYWSIGLAIRVFATGSGDWGSIPGQVIPKTQKKCYLMPPCLTLSIIRYGSRVKWSDPEKGVVTSLHLSVVAIEKGTFGSSSTLVTNFTYFIYIYIYIYIYISPSFMAVKCGQLINSI